MRLTARHGAVSEADELQVGFLVGLSGFEDVQHLLARLQAIHLSVGSRGL